MLLPGLARALARRARPFLERARELDWATGPPAAVAAEARGDVEVRDAAGRPRRLRFRADRADRTEGTTALRLTDYKTGKPLSDAKKPTTRRGHHLAAVARGLKLQATGYARAAGEGGEGRYLHLRPDAEPDAAVAAVAAGDAAFQAAFDGAAATSLAAWDAGAFFPRLEHADQPREPSRCQWCEVSEACLRLDSGARLRLRRWVEEADAAGDAERALHDLWHLDAATGSDGEGER
jgi:RecB family exonuclease